MELDSEKRFYYVSIIGRIPILADLIFLIGVIVFSYLLVKYLQVKRKEPTVSVREVNDLHTYINSFEKGGIYCFSFSNIEMLSLLKGDAYVNDLMYRIYIKVSKKLANSNVYKNSKPI